VSRFRIRPLAVVAALFMISGLALMLGSLTIDERRPTTAASNSSVTVPTLPPSPAAEGRSGGSEPTAPASEPEAARLLEQALDASTSLSYAGVKQVSRWDSGEASSVVLTVENAPGRGTYVAVGDPVDADEAGSPVSVEPGADESAMLAALLRNYTLSLAGTAAVADRDAQVVEAARPDGSLAARFWIDDETALVLRRVLVDAEGRKLESTSFLKVDLEPAASPASSSRPTPSSWERLDEVELDELREAGWPVLSELDAGMDLYEVRRQDSDSDGQVVQLSYTDGLVSMSVFVQQGRLDRTALEGYVAADLAGGEVWVRPSPTSFVVWESTGPAADSVASEATTTPPSVDIVVSVTSDSPSAPIGAVVRALPPREPADAGVGDRLSRGVERVGSWFDPSE
jgi:sigma-E factor negative regulatory protein RseB